MPGQRVVVGLVGARFAASFHARNYRRVHGVDLTIKGVTAKTQESAEAFTRQHGLEVAYPTFDAMLADSDITLVDLCVPNHLHRPMAIQAANAGKHVACEKPLTGVFTDRPADERGARAMLDQAVAGADEVLETIARNGVRLLYAENWVYAPSIQKANHLLAQADGTILRIMAEESHSGSHSPYSKEWRYAGGGSLFHKGCHPLSGALFLKAQEGIRRRGTPIRPRSVLADVSNLTRIESFLAESERWLQLGWKDCEDWGTMIVTFDDGSVAQITAADVSLGGVQNWMTVYSSNTVIQCNISPNTGMMTYAPAGHLFPSPDIREKVETTAGWQYTNPDEDWMNGFPNEMQDFCEAVAHGREPQSGPWLAREVVVVSYGAYLSAIAGRRVDLAPWMDSH